MRACRTLVTGASGFVGQAVCRMLLARGHAVIAAVRSPGVPLPPGAQPVVVGNINSETRWQEALAGCEAIVHLAARAHAGEAMTPDSRREFFRVNVEGSARLLDAALATGVRQLVFLSSSKVYGERSPLDRRGLPVRFTTTSATTPEGPYGESKLAAEQLLGERCADAGIALSIFRPPLIYGPGHKANLLALMKAIASGLPLPLGAIHNTRSLLYLGNLVAAIGLALDKGAAGAGVYPLSDVDLSTPALVRALAAGMDARARLLPVPTWLLRAGGRLLGREAAISRLTDSLLVGNEEAVEHLGWRPVVSFEDAMRETGKWFRARP